MKVVRLEQRKCLLYQDRIFDMDSHLAMAVLLSGSKLPAEAQEKLIAKLARAAYDAHVSRAAQVRQ